MKNTVWGTGYFVSKAAAITYYRPYHYEDVVEAVNRKLADGEIHIGPPPLEPGETLVIIDNGTRYAIRESDQQAADRQQAERDANRIDGYDRDDLGESPDF